MDAQSQVNEELHAAAMAGNVPDIERSLNSGASVDSEDGERKTALIHATVGGHVDAVNALLKAGARTQPLGDFAHTPLRAAALFGRPRITEILLEHGVDTNSCSVGGCTALMGCCRPRPMVDDEVSCEVMNLLLGVPSTCVDLQNDFGETALFLAASSGRAGHVYALLRAGADRSLANRISGQTAVEAAIGDARTVFTAAA